MERRQVNSSLAESGVPKVGISFAHNERQPGAGYEGKYEHEESVLWTNEVVAQLRHRGLGVILVQQASLGNKVRVINSSDVDVALEIHFNGCSNPYVAGCETLYHPGSVKGRELAYAVHTKYQPAMYNKDRGIIEGWYRMDRPGIVDYKGDLEGDERPNYFLRETNCPALILEPDFISQQSNITSCRKEACSAIAQGLANFLGVTYFASF